MKTLLALLLASQSFAAEWHALIRQRAHYWQAPPSNSVKVPHYGDLAMITQNCRITNDTIAISVSMETTGSPQFTYGGEGTWNHGTAPANVRLFFATVPGYNLRMAAKHEDRYWWSANCADLATLTNCVLSQRLDASGWSNANGHRASERPAEFQRAVAHIRQVGVSLGAGSFYDVGVALVPGTGSATIRLNREQ